MAMMKKNIPQINANNFWSSDLSKVEAVFLDDGEKITDLPTKLLINVPPQGSVLLRNIVNVDKVIKKPSIISRIRHLAIHR